MRKYVKFDKEFARKLSDIYIKYPYFPTMQLAAIKYFRES